MGRPLLHTVHFGGKFQERFSCASLGFSQLSLHKNSQKAAVKMA